jgi:para-aminobenzoate synthetase / 4-amino-4-deoxychorismate lyase
MILLDDAQSSVARPSSRLYQDAPVEQWCVYPEAKIDGTLEVITNCLNQITAALSRGQHVVAAFSYELGNYLQHITPKIDQTQSEPQPLILAWAFDAYESLSKEQADVYLKQALEERVGLATCSGIADVQTSITEMQFANDMQAIEQYIQDGDTYQINHTYRVTGNTYGDPLALYMRLRDRQPGHFGAFIENGSHYILSQSPELFIERHGDTLKAMPMKGTASALDQSASHLSDDPKNQAENVMIVDLLRNDLSRLALPGSVTVPSLFTVARHGDVLQMTSTVEARAKPNLSLLDILTAVFPCGSVTGAPKKRSMEIIQELETSERGLYCGALGWLDPSGDFALSVPIRTVEIQENVVTHAATFTLGVGAGITHDSDIAQEWQECAIKSAFLTSLPSAVGLFETILIKCSVAQHLELHLERLANSAKSLGIALNRFALDILIGQAYQECIPEAQYRLRIDLSATGELSYQLAQIEPLPHSVKIFWATELFDVPTQAQMYSGDVLLQHKTTHRWVYDRAWQLAVEKGGFDALFVNEQGYVTEGGRSSIFIKSRSSDSWLTPPLSAGVLPGVMRSIILQDPHWNAHEANLSIEDITSAEEIMLSNALRGAIAAHF